MLNHNRDHAGELAAIAGELERAGMDAAARLVEEGVRGFQAGNEKLAEALASIRGGK
ncbi:MAG: hypothetical protein LBC88_01720 [Spirochaetaceae bacterium]|nr:hypothetical protein [Spirochaetaceae bacterium]